jgi:hypothetical protein
MCGSSPDLPPQADPKAERQQAEADAQAAANAKSAANRRSKRSQSLLAAGAQGAPGAVATSSVLALGKDKLGG